MKDLSVLTLKKGYNSAINKALVTGQSLQNGKKCHWHKLRDLFPIHSFTDFQELYQSNHGTVGNREAGGFVSSAVSPIPLPRQ